MSELSGYSRWRRHGRVLAVWLAGSISTASNLRHPLPPADSPLLLLQKRTDAPAARQHSLHTKQHTYLLQYRSIQHRIWEKQKENHVHTHLL
jgi:hypothetical protein